MDKQIKETMRLQGRARNAVRAAVKNNLLPSLKGGLIRCDDCGNPATEYDHRDYMKPLQVDPVCHSCNVKRGAAINHKPPGVIRAEKELADKIEEVSKKGIQVFITHNNQQGK